MENYENISSIDSVSDTLPQIIIGITVDLRQVIDQLDRDFKKAKDLIIEIARSLDEGKFCERDCISRKLKVDAD